MFNYSHSLFILFEITITYENMLNIFILLCGFDFAFIISTDCFHIFVSSSFGELFILTCYLLGDLFVKIISHRLEIAFLKNSTCFYEKIRLLSVKGHFSHTHNCGFSVYLGKT